MRIPPYWARSAYKGTDSGGQPREFAACGWSFTSLQDATNEATARAKRIFEFLASGTKPDHYDYFNTPIKEEILKEISDGDSSVAVITRNRYGALVLNCSNVLFVDVDFPRPRAAGFLEAVLLLFSAAKRNAKREAVIQETIQQVKEWAQHNPPHSFRLYRTKEGLRLLFTGKLYDPASEETASILSGLKADPLYVKLTQKQQCFRARLTAKPWRCGCARPPAVFPWDNAAAERKFREWETEYTKRDAEFKVCELIGEFGMRSDIAPVKTVVDVHDRGSRIEAHAELA